MNKKLAAARAPRLSALALAVQAACGVSAWALPQGAVVVNGAVSMAQPAAGTLQVNAGNGAIINWQRFSIGSGEVTKFVQPDAASAVLNRVTGADVSSILGQLQANGRVFLINPNGIVVGAGARIDTNSFIASTLDMADADFLAGRLKFMAGNVAGAIRNDGIITAGPGGKIALIAPDIVNSGIISAPDGQILLAAGRSIEIASSDLAGVRFEVRAPSDSVLNLGKLLADNGAVRVFASTLRQEGVIRADRLVAGADGTIQLVGSGDVTVAAGSVTSASGAAGMAGGAVTVRSEAGTTRVGGQVLATGAGGQGGQVQVLGQLVAVEGGATVDASGRDGGGTILVGGAFQGSDPDVQNAQRTYVGEGATLRADATRSGDGGKVVVWADENTRYYGALSARGGAQGGNGGYAEVSGRENLDFRGTADLSAPQGSFGTLLLDPKDLVVANGSGILPTVVDEFSDFSDNVATIDPARLNELQSNVVLAATRDIYVKDAIGLTTQGAGITLLAGGASATGGAIWLENSALRPGGITTTGGDVVMRAQTVQGGANGTGSISTNGGKVDIQVTGTLSYGGAISTAGGSVNLVALGQVNYANVDAGSGAITVQAQGSINSGTYTTTGTAGFTTSSYLSGTQATAGVVNLQAQSSIYALVSATDRVNANSANSSVELHANGSGPLRLGTVASPSSYVRIYSPIAGIEQASGGSISTRNVLIFGNGPTATIGSASAPISLAWTNPNTSGMSVNFSGLAAPAYVNAGGTTIVRDMGLDGNLAGLSTFHLTGSSNLGAWTFGNASGRLSVSGSATSGFDGAFTLTVSNAGLNIPNLNLQGGGRASFTAYNGNGITLGNVTTTRTGNTSGLDVTVGNCTYTWAACTSTAPILITGALNVAADASFRLWANGNVTSTGTIHAQNLSITAGGLYNNGFKYIWPWGYVFVATTNNFDLNSVTTTGSVSLTNAGNGSLHIGTLAATGSVYLANGTSYVQDLGITGAFSRTVGDVTVTNSDPSSTFGYWQVYNYATGNVGITGRVTRPNFISMSAQAGDITANALSSTSSSLSLSATGAVTADAVGGYYGVSLSAGTSITTADVTALAGGMNLSAGTSASIGSVSAAYSISASTGGDFTFDKLSSVFGNVTLQSTSGQIATRQDDAAIDVTARGSVSISAADTTNGFIGNVAFANPMDIQSVNGQAITLAAGRDIGASGKDVRVDTTSSVDISSAAGQWHVTAVDLGVGNTGLRNVSTIRLSASAAGVGAGNESDFTSLNLSLRAASDGTNLTIGDPGTGNIAQSAGVLNEFSFRGLDTTGLKFGGVALSTSGLNQLGLTAGGAITQTSGDITAAGNTVLNAGGDVALNNVTLSGVLLDGLHVSTPGNVTAGAITARSIDISGNAVSVGDLSGTGTYRGYWDYQYVPRYGYYNYWPREEVKIQATGSLSTGNVSSRTSVQLSAGTDLVVGGGAGTVTGGTSYSFNGSPDQVRLAAVGLLRAGDLSGNDVGLQGPDIQVGNLSGNYIHSSGGLFTAGTINSTGTVNLSGSSLSIGQTTGSNIWLDATSLNHTGDVAAANSLSITVHGAYAPDYNLSAGNSASIVADGDITVGQRVLALANVLFLAQSLGTGTGTGTLSAPRVTLQTTAGSNGNINANLQGTSDLTLRADAGYYVTTNTYLTNLDVTAQWDKSAINGSASVLSSVYDATNLVYDSQSFSVSNNLRGSYDLAATATYANPSARGTWNIAYRDTSANAVTGGLEVNVAHAQGGRFDLRLDSDTHLNTFSLASPRYAATVDAQTGGSINLTSVYTNGGPVNAWSRGSALANGGIVVGNVVTDVYGATAGDVALTSSKGDIRFDPGSLAAPNRGISTSSYIDAVPSDRPSGRVALSAPLGSIGVEGAGGELPVAYASTLSVEAANTINVAVTGALSSLSIDTGASIAATGSVRVANTSFVNATGAFTGMAIDRDGLGNLLWNGVQGDSNAPGDFSLIARGGGIIVGDNVANVRNLSLQAETGDLVVSAVGRGSSLSMAASGVMDLRAGNDIKLVAGTASSESVSVTANELRTLDAGRDLLLQADGGSVQVTGSSPVYYTQNLEAGRDFIVQGGATDGAFAQLQTQGGWWYQYLTAGRDFTIRAGAGAGSTAVVDTSQHQYGQYVSVGGNLTVAGSGGAGSSARFSSVADTQSITVGGNLSVTGGTGTDAFAVLSNSNVGAAGNQSGYIGGDFIVQGGNATTGQGTGAYAAFTGSSQNFTSIAGTLRVAGGTASGNHAEIVGAGSQSFGNAFNSYSSSSATNQVQVQGGTAADTYARISATGSQTIYTGKATSEITVSGDITVTGGSGLNAYASIDAAGGQNIGSAYSYCGYYGCSVPTHDVLITGGSANGAYATISGGSQYVQAGGAVKVIGGSATDASAHLQSTGSQTIGTNYIYSTDTTDSVEVRAGSGAIASITAVGSQGIYVGGNILVQGGTGANMTASIESTGGSQQIGYTYRYGYDATDNIIVRGGTGTGARATIAAATGQTLQAANAITLSGGAAGANASVTNAAGGQTIGVSPSDSYYYAMAQSIALAAGAGSSAKIDDKTGTQQRVSTSGNLSLTGGSGINGSAFIIGGVSQSVYAGGAISLAGGTSAGTTAQTVGIRMATDGNQSVQAGGDITLTGGAGLTDVGIVHQGVLGTQSVVAGGNIVLQAPNAGVGIVAIGNQAAGGQFVSVGNAISISNAAGKLSGIYSAGPQSITARSMAIENGSSVAGSMAGVTSDLNQTITLTGDGVTAGSATLSIRNTGTGAGSLAGITAGGSLDLMVSDNNYDTAGAVTVGNVADTGASVISAVGDMRIVAGSLTVQGGATPNANAAINASGPTSRMVISTLYGSMQLLAGSAGSATIDPAVLSVVSNGSVLLQGGGAPTAFSNISAGTFNLAATFGDLNLQNNVGSATISATTFNFFGPNVVNLNGGTITVGSSGTIDIPGLCINCGTNLLGNWTVKALAPPAPPTGPGPIPDLVNITSSNVIVLTDLAGRTWEIVTLDDGTLIVTRSRRNQCI